MPGPGPSVPVTTPSGAFSLDLDTCLREAVAAVEGDWGKPSTAALQRPGNYSTGSSDIA